jgi:hypothetical protein
MDRRNFLKSAGAVAAATPFLSKAAHANEHNVPEPAAETGKDFVLGVPIGDAELAMPSIGLAGTWSFQLDSAGLGVEQRWFNHDLGGETIFLPGSTDQAGYGDKTHGPDEGHLSRPYIYKGPAWYQKKITIPETWKGRHITLYLERCHWQTSAWIDGKSYGAQNSLSAPHVYDLGIEMKSGFHTLTLCVDNTLRIDIGATAHAVTEQTQTDWNGIIGKIELRATPPARIERVRAFPDLEKKQVSLELLLRNGISSPVSGKLEAILRRDGSSMSVNVPSFTGDKVFTMTIPLLEPVRQWDELQPSLYVADLRFTSNAGSESYEHRYSVQFGMREISTGNRQFLLNGRPVFLRGTVENAVFPLTAYPPMQRPEWDRIFRILRSYGMNHLRFHSWCPPECAFRAADEAGILLHVELPVFSHHLDTTPGLEEFMRQEAHRILETYGNHPSFILLCMGNELKGDYPFLDALVVDLKQADNRRLYTYSTNNGRPAPGPTSEYWVTEETKQGRLRIDRTRFGATPGGTDYDFSKAIAGFEVPVVAHELGQWAVYPSYEEIDEYTGVLKPRNLEVYREQLAARGMGDQAELFQAASGRFAAEVYKEDIESAIRTPNFGGFQLLELTDYPGQNEALVGVLDCFWNSKGVITPDAFRRFCGDTVPLLRFSKFVWRSNEIFRAQAEVAHYGKESIRQPMILWSVQDDAGQVLRSGRLRSATIAAGGITSLGTIEFPLSTFREAMRLNLTLEVKGLDVMNRWSIWNYPASLSLPKPGAVMMTTDLNSAAMQHLQDGGTVFVSAPPRQQGSHLLKLRFLPVFWSFGMFKKQPGLLGILCDPHHPALASFPSDMHSNWQWWELTEGTNAFILNEAPLGFRPLIQVIDDFHRNDKLGLVFEAQVGKGKLLATSLCLTEDLGNKPVCRQLLYSLLQYVSGNQFQPESTVDLKTLTQLFAKGT